MISIYSSRLEIEVLLFLFFQVKHFETSLKQGITFDINDHEFPGNSLIIRGCSCIKCWSSISLCFRVKHTYI